MRFFWRGIKVFACDKILYVGKWQTCLYVVKNNLKYQKTLNIKYYCKCGAKKRLQKQFTTLKTILHFSIATHCNCDLRFYPDMRRDAMRKFLDQTCKGDRNDIQQACLYNNAFATKSLVRADLKTDKQNLGCSSFFYYVMCPKDDHMQEEVNNINRKLKY